MWFTTIGVRMWSEGIEPLKNCRSKLGKVQTVGQSEASTHRGALREFVRCHHLHVQVFALRLPPGFHQPLEHLSSDDTGGQTQDGEVVHGRGDHRYLRGGHLHVHDDGCQRGFGELGGMVDGVRVQDHQLQGFGQFEYPLDLTLDLSWTDRVTSSTWFTAMTC